ncbi:serine/threonine protein kinase [Glycomyces dulcitolivorans]|uniref:serine/threonine protein kinase n=1 Tax=Glycomyces dulcitolivorans TaxID=2200759 RepID=UPI000DD321EC|nr:protein kinase [Glycomyces dulcitolivorans]
MASKFPPGWEKVPGTDPPNSGQGFVYQVRRIGSSEKFALKRLRNPDNPRRSERFSREVAAMKELYGLGVPVPKVEADDLDADKPWFIMPWYPDGSLQKLIGSQSRRLDTLSRLRLVAKIADALALVHQQGLAHRDIKPENILLNGDQILLADFGLCISIEDARLTETSEIVGPRLYMAPEHESGISEEVDQRPGDCYSWAKLAWAVIAVRNPPAREAVLEEGKQLHRLLGDNRLLGMHQLFERILVIDPRARLKDWAAIQGDLRHTMRLFDENQEESSSGDRSFSEALLAASQIGSTEEAVERRLKQARTERRRRDTNRIEQILADEIGAQLGEDLRSLNEASRYEVSASIAGGGPSFPALAEVYDFGLSAEVEIEHYSQHSNPQAGLYLTWTMPGDKNPNQHGFSIGIYVITQGDSFRLIRTPFIYGGPAMEVREIAPGSIRVSEPLPLGLASAERESRLFAQESAEFFRTLLTRFLLLIRGGKNPNDAENWE